MIRERSESSFSSQRQDSSPFSGTSEPSSQRAKNISIKHQEVCTNGEIIEKSSSCFIELCQQQWKPAKTNEISWEEVKGAQRECLNRNLIIPRVFDLLRGPHTAFPFFVFIDFSSF
jgi:hypothetical protein